MPLQTQFKIFIEELTAYDNNIKQENASIAKKNASAVKKNASTNKKKYVMNYIKVVRIFLSRDQFDGVVKEYKHWNMPHEGT